MRSTLLRAALIVGCASVVSVWYPIRGKYAVTSCSHCLLCIRHVILISHGLGVRQDVTHDTFIGTSWLRNYRQMWLSGYSALTLETSAPGLPGYYVIWYMIYDIWYMIYDTLNMINDIWYMINDIWYMIYPSNTWVKHVYLMPQVDPADLHFAQHCGPGWHL